MKQVKLHNTCLCAEIDDEDFNKVSSYEFPWRLQINGYVVASSTNTTTVYLHKFILDNPDCEIDHKDRNKLNCCKENLRLCPTKGHNRVNRSKTAPYYSKPTSKYKGVTYKRRYRKWQTAITVGDRQIYGGQFDSEIEAARKADELYLKYFGEFAVLNLKSRTYEMANNTKGSSVVQETVRRSDTQLFFQLPKLLTET